MVSKSSKSKQLAAQSAHADLPNLNRGLITKQLNCSIHPSIVSQILDHYMRKPNEQSTVMGALLGNVDGSNGEIKTSFGIPFSQQKDGSVTSVDFDYAEKMYKFHRKVNPKEGMIGLYKSGKVVDKDTIEIWYEYMQKLMTNSKTAVLPQPLLMLIDPEMTDNKLAIKVLSFVSAPEIRKSEWEDEDGEQQSKLEQVQVFSECPFTMQIKEFEKTGLDVVFYGQDHYDTMAIMQSEKEIDYNTIPDLKEKQKLYSNKDLMSKNFGEVIDNLTECEKYIQEVVDGKREGDS